MGGGFLTEYDVETDNYGTGDAGGGGDYYYYEDYEAGGEGGGGDYPADQGEDYPCDGGKQTDTKLPEDYDVRERKRRRRKRQAENVEEYDYESVKKGGAIQTDKAWIYNGLTWEEKAPMSVARDRPACSLVNMPNGEVGCKT